MKYLTEKQRQQHNQYLAFMSVLAKYGITKHVQIAKLLGMTPQAWYKRYKGEMLNLQIVELHKIAKKLDMEREDLSYIVEGVRR